MSLTEYDNYDGIGLADLVRRKEVSAEELLDTALERVDAHDDSINAVVQDLEDLARDQIKNRLHNGPFMGVPFLLKDIGIDLKGSYNTNGSRFHCKQPATQNSNLAERYLDAGLVIFGKTNTPEFAISGSTEPEALGKCRNPWDLDRGTGGSSGGAAASVAAGYAPMAHASDGGGSIRNPSSACGLFGLKPTRGRVVSGPDIYVSTGGMAIQHAITRSVRDSAALLDASSSDSTAAVALLETIEMPLKPLKVAFHTDAHHTVKINPECRQAVLQAAKTCEDLGHSVEEARPEIDGIEALEIASLLWKVGVAQKTASISRIIGRAPLSGELEWITRLLAEEGSSIFATEYADAVNFMHRIGAKLDEFFQRYDVVLSPVVSQPPWLLDVYENSYSDTKSYFETIFSYSPFCWPYNMSGQPAMSVPLHWTPKGLPVGVQFAGQYGDEATLLRLARQLEIAIPWFDRRPTFQKQVSPAFRTN